MYSDTRNVIATELGTWEVKGEWCEDHYIYHMQYFVIAHCEDGKYVHEFTFVDDGEAAERLRLRVEERGVIDLRHWGFHEFFSLTLEEKFAEEAYHEDLHRRGYGHLSNGCFSDGHV